MVERLTSSICFAAVRTLAFLKEGMDPDTLPVSREAAIAMELNLTKTPDLNPIALAICESSP